MKSTTDQTPEPRTGRVTDRRRSNVRFAARIPIAAALTALTALLASGCGGSARLGAGAEALVGSYDWLSTDGAELPLQRTVGGGCSVLTPSGGLELEASGEGRFWEVEGMSCVGGNPLEQVKYDREEEPFSWRIAAGNTLVLFDEEYESTVRYRLNGSMLTIVYPDGQVDLYRRR